MNTNPKRVCFVYRLVMIAAGLFAVTVIFLSNLEDRVFPGALAHTLAYFTIQSNLLVLGWNVASVVRGVRGREQRPYRPFIRAASAVYITITCVVYALFIGPYWNPTGVMAVATILLHYIIPIAFVIDWVISEKPGSLKTRFIPLVIPYPLVYLGGSLIFAHFTGVYVYPFIDLAELGHRQFLLNCAGLAAAFLVLGAVYFAVDRFKLYVYRRRTGSRIDA